MKTYDHLTENSTHHPKDFRAVRTITYDEDHGCRTCWIGVRKDGRTVDISEELGQETLDYFDLWASVRMIEDESKEV